MELVNYFEQNNVLFYGGSSLLAYMWINTLKKKNNIFLTQHLQEIKIKGCNIFNVEHKISKKDLISIIKKIKLKLLLIVSG